MGREPKAGAARGQLAHTLIGAALMALTAIAWAAPAAFESDGVRIEFPPGWLAIPPEQIVAARKAIEQRAPGAKVPVYDFAAQFARGGKQLEDWFIYPYVTVQVRRGGQVPEAEFLKLEQTDMSGVASGVEKSTSGLVSGVELGKLRYDRQTQRAWMLADSEVDGVGHVSGVTTLIPTAFGYVQIGGYAKQKDFPGFLAMYNGIIDAIAISDNAKYGHALVDKLPSAVANAPAVASGINWDKVASQAVVGAVLGALGGLFAWRRKKSTGRPEKL